jgi:2-C-methyl-D-erythritol 2,4-cyclodiphosphate synthase
MLGGVQIPSKLGLAGHSDADVLLHALTDALLGALALPDIGSLFPDTDPKWKDAASGPLLAEAYEMVKAEGYQLVNADCVLVCDQPRLRPYYVTIRNEIADILNVGPSRIGLKVKTTEGTLLALKRKSIAAMVVVLVVREGTFRSRESTIHSPKSPRRRAR